MRPALVRFVLPDGSVRTVPPGGILGRLSHAALRLEDPRVSEAHALVSLRGRTLWLLALRGAIAVDGKAVPEVALRPGLKVQLGPELVLKVEAVQVDDRALALRVDGGAAIELVADTYSLVGGGLHAGFDPDATVRVWSTATGWRLGIGDAPSVDVIAGRAWPAAGHTLEAIDLPLAGVAATEDRGRLHRPLEVVAGYSSAYVRVEGGPQVTLDGIPGRIVSELCEYREPVPWPLVANAIWPGESEEQMRPNWDRNRRTLRDKLAAGGVRVDLVRTDGHGNVELFLHPGDQVTVRGS